MPSGVGLNGGSTVRQKRKPAPIGVGAGDFELIKLGDSKYSDFSENCNAPEFIGCGDAQHA